MAVLAKEAIVFPDALLADKDRPSLNDWLTPEEGGASSWVVFHTKPRAEKALARRLTAMETPFYLPLYEKVYRQQRRTVRSYHPLFPGYVFACVNENQRYAALTTNQIANCLLVEDQKRLYSDLFQLHWLVESNLPITPEDRIQPGTPAEIVSGPLKGHRGKVIRRSTGMRLVVEVDFLQSGASVEVESFDIRVI